MSKPIEKNKKKYIEYVQKKLKEYKVDSPDKVPDKFKKKFYTELDKGWESKKEKKEKKKKAEVIAAVKKVLSNNAGISSQTSAWNKTLHRVVHAILDNLAKGNGSGVKSQVAILRKSCDDLDDLIEDYTPKRAVTKIAPKQPPMGWWRKMHSIIKKKNPEYSAETLDKIIGDIWYNKMDMSKKKEVTKEFES